MPRRPRAPLPPRRRRDFLGVTSSEWWKTRRRLAAIAAEVAASLKVVLYEGLPHKRIDRVDGFRATLKTKPTIKIQEDRSGHRIGGVVCG